jgi:hypothetical protein
VTRRAALRTGAYGSAAVMVGGLGAAGAQAATRVPEIQAAEQATRAYDFNQGWLFGGVYTPGAELTGHNDSRFAHITVPHTVVPLSWADWDHRTWEKRWIYRKHFTGRPSPARVRASAAHLRRGDDRRDRRAQRHHARHPTRAVTSPEPLSSPITCGRVPTSSRSSSTGTGSTSRPTPCPAAPTPSTTCRIIYLTFARGVAGQRHSSQQRWPLARSATSCRPFTTSTWSADPSREMALGMSNPRGIC